MGRQAYLARLALGRSAFEAPLKDENGEFVLGAGARINDDRSHYQEWDDRGHPQNKKSEDAAKNYRMSQNQILESCGVLVKRNALEKVKKENSKRAWETELVMSENNFGEMLKISDSVVGFALTWWITTLRRRLITFGAFDHPLMSSISESLRHEAVSFFSAGLAFHIAAWTLRQVRHFLNEPGLFTLFDDVDVEDDTTPRTFATKLTVFSASVMLFLNEIPLDIASSLSSLGLPLAATTTSISKYWPTSSDLTGPNQYLWLRLLSYLYFRDHVAHNFSRRLFAVFDQCFIQPRYPSPASAAVSDELVDPSSIPMVGRSFNSQTHPSFLRRPVNFLTALYMAFSPGWIQSKNAFDKMLSKEKQHILRTIAEYELESGCQNEFDTALALARVRVASIVQWLAESQFQVAHIRLTNFDQWAEEVDYHIDELRRERANLARAQIERVDDHNDQEEDRPRETESENRRNESPSSNSAIAGTEARSAFMGLGEQREAGTMLLSPMRSSTPEPGIRRATSLIDSTAGNGQLSSTVSVVVNGTSSNDVQACVRRVYLKYRISGPPQHGNGEHRVTRLSTFAAESLAWHTSSIITNLLILPFDSAVCRLIALSSSRLIGTPSSSVLEISPVLRVDEWFGGPRAGWLGRWRYASMLTLTFGLESLVRFGIWRIGVGVALRQAEFYQWGSF